MIAVIRLMGGTVLALAYCLKLYRTSPNNFSFSMIRTPKILVNHISQTACSGDLLAMKLAAFYNTHFFAYVMPKRNIT